MSLPLPPRTGHTYFAVDISTRPGFSASSPRIVFEDPEMQYTAISFLDGYDVALDGRFLMVKVLVARVSFLRRLPTYDS